MSTLLLIGPVALDERSVTSFVLSDGWEFPDHDVIETKPKVQWTGTQKRSVTVGLRFHVLWCDPGVRMEALRALGATVAAWPVVRGSGAWLGRFVVVGIRETDRWTLSTGRPLWIEAEVKLEESAGALPTGVGPALAGAVASPLLRRIG